MRCALVLVLACTFSACGVEVSVPAYIVRGNAPAALGFVQTDKGWLLLKCNTEQDFLAYRHDNPSNDTCHVPLARHFTTAELATAQQQLSAELDRGKQDHVVGVAFAAALAAASALVSRAVVADMKKVVAITLVVGFTLFHVHRKLLTIVSLREEKRVALAELLAPDVRHNSDGALVSIEEVLLRYLPSTPVPSAD